MPLLLDLPLHILVQALVVAFGVAVVSGRVVGFFTRRSRDDDSAPDRGPEDR